MHSHELADEELGVIRPLVEEVASLHRLGGGVSLPR